MSASIVVSHTLPHFNFPQRSLYWISHYLKVDTLTYFAGADKRILVWDIGNGSQVYELKRHTDIVYQLSFSRDGTILASGQNIHTAR